MGIIAYKKKGIFLKFAWGIFFLLIALLCCIGFLFTPLGNKIALNYLLNSLEQKTSIKWIEEEFSITPTKIHLHLNSEDKNLSLILAGDYSLITQNLDLNLLLESKGFDFQAFNKSLHLPHNFLFNGTIKGNFQNYSLEGQGGFLENSGDLHMTFSYLTPQTLNLDFKNFPLSTALEILKEKKYAEGLLDIHSKIQWINHIPKGDINVNLQGGYAISQTFLEEFNLKIPTTNFMADLTLNLENNLLKHQLNFYSNLGEIKTQGNTQIKTFTTDTNYNANLSSLAPLSAFIKIPIQGKFAIKGLLKGDLNNMLTTGDLSLQESKFNYTLNLDNFYPKTLQMHSNNLQAKDLFMFFGEKPYLEGIFNVNLNLRDFNKGISGTALLVSKDLFINSPLIEEKTQLGFPHTTFKLYSSLELAEGSGILNLDFNSNLLNLKIQNASYSLLSDIKAPISLQIPKLQNISFNNKSLPSGELNLQGSLSQSNLFLKGEITQNNQNIETTILNMNDRLFFNLSNISTSEIYKIFNYPHFFKGVGDFTFTKYNGLEEILFSSKELMLNNPLLKAIEKSSKMSFKNTKFTGTFSQTLAENQIKTRFTLEKNDLKFFNYEDLITKDSRTQGNVDVLKFDNYPYKSKSFFLKF
ncbi:hypothetical protein [Helicobacter burdigaliensis]|uniref:hypothetical protein n=1 Tax=Helicobacter burdigaliensis TaxID=2315334 RepID=UPI000EF6B637|nr:hypothetical protein [Helicobacter burdigaliensis]